MRLGWNLYFLYKGVLVFLGVQQRTKSFSRSIWMYRGEMGDVEISAEVMAFFSPAKRSQLICQPCIPVATHERKMEVCYSVLTCQTS